MYPWFEQADAHHFGLLAEQRFEYAALGAALGQLQHAALGQQQLAIDALMQEECSC